MLMGIVFLRLMLNLMRTPGIFEIMWAIRDGLQDGRTRIRARKLTVVQSLPV